MNLTKTMLEAPIDFHLTQNMKFRNPNGRKDTFDLV